jgi:methylmalonyl-CoA mutase N-terminal domain/subunit
MTSEDSDPRPKRTFRTSSGIEVERVYSEGVSRADYSRRLGDPGQYPYARGVRERLYRDRTWTMRQYAGFGTSRESNQRFRYLLDQGQDGLSVAFDLPTQMGLDSDHPLAAGEVGRVGVAIDTLEDMRALFAGIPLDRVSTSMTINSTAAVMLAFYIAVAEERGVPLNRLRGTVQNDMLKEYVARGTQIYPPGPSLRLVADVVEYSAGHLPRWNPISISGYHIREAGSDAGAELAFTLANAIAYVEALRARGLEVDSFAGRLSFFFSVHNEFLEEIAKFRAARRMWARIVRDRFGASDPRSMMLRFHAQTAGSTLTAQFPDGNIVRVSLQTLAAALGGAQSIHANSKDEALALPREANARLALRTQQVIAWESGIRDTDDPVGGAFAIEALTDRIEAEAEAHLGKIEAQGGMLAAIESGYIRKEIEAASYRFQRDVEAGERVVVGVNRFRSDEDAAGPDIRIHRADPEAEGAQVRCLEEIRRRRDPVAVGDCLERLASTARTTENLMPAILDAARIYASVGEISGALGRVFGEDRGAR